MNLIIKWRFLKFYDITTEYTTGNVLKCLLNDTMAKQKKKKINKFKLVSISNRNKFDNFLSFQNTFLFKISSYGWH